jgi:hypothetical protein
MFYMNVRDLDRVIEGILALGSIVLTLQDLKSIIILCNIVSIADSSPPIFKALASSIARRPSIPID